jgi:hypothetical protein
VLATIGSRRFDGYESVPNLVDLAQTNENRALLAYAAHVADVGQALVGPPDFAADRLAALREPFDPMMKDEALLQSARDWKVEIARAGATSNCWNCGTEAHVCSRAAARRRRGVN